MCFQKLKSKIIKLSSYLRNDKEFYMEYAIDLSNLPKDWQNQLPKQLPLIISNMCNNCPIKNNEKCNMCNICSLNIENNQIIYMTKPKMLNHIAEIGFYISQFYHTSTSNISSIIFEFISLKNLPNIPLKDLN